MPQPAWLVGPPKSLPAYIDRGAAGNIEPPFGQPPIPIPIPMFMPPIPKPIVDPLPLTADAAYPPTLEPRSHSSAAAAMACCATAYWYACFAIIIACWCAARNAGSDAIPICGGAIMNCCGDNIPGEA